MHCESLKNLKGPAIIASNHPNSMHDAAIIGLYCGQPIHYTIRSDMFQISAFRILLKGLNGIPVYRQSESKSHVRNNASMIENSMDILRNNGVILIFSEGVTEHEWKLKPVKSGIASLVWECRKDDYLSKSLKVLPLGITYCNFETGHKTIYVHSRESIAPFLGKEWETEGEWKKEFKEELFDCMLPLAPQLSTENKNAIDRWKFILTNYYQSPNWKTSNTIEELNKLASNSTKLNLPSDHFPLTYNRRTLNLLLSIILLPFAIAGYLLNGLFFFPLRAFARAKTKGTIFFDSVFIGALLLLYPMYWLLIGAVLSFTIPFGWLWFIAAPITAWLAIEWNYNISSLLNYFSASSEQKQLAKDLLGA